MSQPRALVIDDEPDICELLSLTLGRMQIETEAAGDVGGAKQKLESQAYWPQGVGSQLNVYGGVRYTAFDDRYDITLGTDPVVTRRSDDDYVDALLGVRYRFDLSERWGLLTRGDVSFGDSEGTWLVQGLLAYTVGKRQQNRILFGYQYKVAEFESSGLSSDYTFSGPMAGFNFRF